VALGPEEGLENVILPSQQMGAENVLEITWRMINAMNTHVQCRQSGIHPDGILIHLDGVLTHLDGTQIHLDGIKTHLDGMKIHLDGILIHLDGVHLDGIETHLDGILIHLDTTVTHLDGTQIHLVGIQIHLDGIKFGIQTHLAGDQSRMELPKKQLYTFIMMVM